MAKYKVGDRVKIRQWDDMEKEFGINYHGTIACSEGFVDSMKPLCGRTATIRKISGKVIRLDFDDKNGCTNWNYSTDMIKPIEQEFHEFDTVKHKKYGIGTVVSVGYFVLVDFDEWNEDFDSKAQNLFSCHSFELELIKAYLPK